MIEMNEMVERELNKNEMENWEVFQDMDVKSRSWEITGKSCGSSHYEILFVR